MVIKSIPDAIAKAGHETVELRYYVPPYKDPVPISPRPPRARIAI